MQITIITDNTFSWFIPYGEQLKSKLQFIGHHAEYVFKKQDIIKGDICFLLSCSRIVEQNYLNYNVNNIVVHASNLPSGKGFSPLQWQILEGKNEIFLTLFEAVNDVDAGPFYFKDKIIFKGNELLNEMRDIMGKKIIDMCLFYVNNQKDLFPIEQEGDETFYRRRIIEDDEIDINKSIAEQFNLFRIADNKHFPLWFRYKGKKMYLKIFEENSDSI